MKHDFLPRLTTPHLEYVLGFMPVAVVTGARQAGKSTLVRHLADVDDRAYLSLDDLDVRAQAREAPEELARRAPRSTIDEVQREPELLIAVKRVVDEDLPRRPGRFILTGSANLLLMKSVNESLAGRAVYVTLWPLTRREKLGQGRAGLWGDLLSAPTSEWPEVLDSAESPPADWRRDATVGGFPTPAVELASDEERRVWFDGYVRTYLERDLPDLAAVSDVLDYRRLMKVACLRLGGIMNKSEMGRDAALPQATAHRYLSLLETSYQLVPLQPYKVNRTSRLVKSPKAYWSDTGLALALAGEVEPRGAHLENLVLLDLLAWRSTQPRRPEVLYWRTRTGAEVDFVVEHESGLLPIEVKSSARVGWSDAEGIRAFREEYGADALGGLLLHGGDETFWVGEGVLAAPWWRVV